jgi:nucleotide-binding universal stress UspA family protein
MSKVLIPIDGSECSLRALDVVLKRRKCEAGMDIHLLNVQLPIDSGHARMFVSEEELCTYHQAEGAAALAVARKMLDDAGAAYSWHVLVGHASETIATFAHENGFDEIVMGTHGRSGLTHLLLGSIASDVMKIAQLPVTLVK